MIKLAIFISLFFYSMSTMAQPKAVQVDNLLSAWSKTQTPGLAVMVSQDGAKLYERYFGVADLSHLNPIDSETRFQIASVSKQFTAFAIALLVERKKISLTDDIRRYLPELQDYGETVTILNLLHHTSGLRDLDDLNQIVGIGFADYNNIEHVYRLLSRQSALNFAPGEHYDYSNSGYVLLAKIVEKITNMGFREFMQSEVFGPLEMDNTLIFDNAFEVVTNRATAYFSSDNQAFSRDNGQTAVYGSTGIYTTVSDLDRWARNFYQHKVGNQAIFDLMLTVGALNNGERTQYAFGQELKTHNGHRAVFHGGGTGGYRAYLIRFPEQKLSISMLSNNSYSGTVMLEYVNRIANIYLNEQVQSESLLKKENHSPEVVVPKELLFSYLGDYQIQPGLIFSFKAIEHTMALTITGNSQPIPLKAISNNTFILMDSASGNRVIFVSNKGKTSQAIRYFQGDFEYQGKRVELVDFDETKIRWHDVEGLYYSADLNTSYIIEFDGTKLVAIHATNSPIPLTPFQPDQFTSNATYFQQVSFERGADNRVSKMWVSGSRSKNIEFRKVSEIER